MSAAQAAGCAFFGRLALKSTAQQVQNLDKLCRGLIFNAMEDGGVLILKGFGKIINLVQFGVAFGVISIFLGLLKGCLGVV